AYELDFERLIAVVIRRRCAKEFAVHVCVRPACGVGGAEYGIDKNKRTADVHMAVGRGRIQHSGEI
ncbi:hypothetical protein, partial [Pseudomonas viridiflava]|uniref:hypothetical protein n=1 Tax=Pseudomonas viridiflava TaxID=33069 RepID=UPI0019671A0A